MKSRAAVTSGHFRAHQAFLTDVDLFSEVYDLIEAGHSAAWSWQKVIDQRVAEVEQVANERLAGQAADLHDVVLAVLRLLTGTQSEVLCLTSL